MMYCRLISELAATTPQRLILATSSDTLGSAEFRTHMHHLMQEIEIFDLGPLPETANMAFQRSILKSIDELKSIYRDAKILVMEGDKFVLPLGLFRMRHRRDITVLIMRAPDFDRGINKAAMTSWIKRLGMAISRFRGVKVKVLAPALRAAPSYEYRGFSAVPDPVDLASTPESIERYRHEVGVDDARVWIGVFGHISPRKNLDLVIDALGSCGATDYGLLVAGKIDESELSRCSSSIRKFRDAGGEIIFDSRLLSDGDLDSAIGCVSVVAIAHSSEGPSGILGKAAAAGVNVAAAGALSLREDIDRLRAGFWSPLTVDAFAQALRNAATHEKFEKSDLANGRDFATALTSMETSEM